MASISVPRCGNDATSLDDVHVVDLDPGETATFDAILLQPPSLPAGSYFLTLHYKIDPEFPCDPCGQNASLRLRMSPPLELESNLLRVVFTTPN